MDIKNRTSYFFNDIINTENFNPNNIKIDEKSNKNIFIYYIGYMTVKEFVKIYSVNPMYLIRRNVNGHFEEINESKYLTVVPNNESKEITKIYENLMSKIRSIIKNSDDYDEKYMKIEFNSDDKLLLNKMIKISTMTIVVRAAFDENNKYSPQVFLDECVYKL